MNVPVKGLVSKDYAKKIFNEINPSKAKRKSDRGHGNPFAYEKIKQLTFQLWI